MSESVADPHYQPDPAPAQADAQDTPQADPVHTPPDPAGTPATDAAHTLSREEPTPGPEQAHPDPATDAADKSDPNGMKAVPVRIKNWAYDQIVQDVASQPFNSPNALIVEMLTNQRRYRQALADVNSLRANLDLIQSMLAIERQRADDAVQVSRTLQQDVNKLIHELEATNEQLAVHRQDHWEADATLVATDALTAQASRFEELIRQLCAIAGQPQGLLIRRKKEFFLDHAARLYQQIFNPS